MNIFVSSIAGSINHPIPVRKELSFEPLKEADPKELYDRLSLLFNELVRENRLKEAEPLFKRLAAPISLREIEAALSREPLDALKDAKEMVEEAKLYFKIVGSAHPLTLQGSIFFLLDSIVTFFGTLITALGISDLFTPPESELHAESKFRNVFMWMSFSSLFGWLLAPIASTPLGKSILYALGGGVLGLSLLWPAIRPKTTYLPANAENWTKQIQEGRAVLEGRKESLDEIASIIR